MCCAMRGSDGPRKWSVNSSILGEGSLSFTSMSSSEIGSAPSRSNLNCVRNCWEKIPALRLSSEVGMKPTAYATVSADVNRSIDICPPGANSLDRHLCDGPANSLLLAPELKNAVVFGFSVSREEPLLGEMVFVLDGQYQLAHVPVARAGQVGGIDKIKGKGLAVIRNLGLHARLILRGAIVSHHQAAAVHVIHSHHALFLHGFHHYRASGNDLPCDGLLLAAGVLGVPLSGQGLQAFE